MTVPRPSLKTSNDEDLARTSHTVKVFVSFLPRVCLATASTIVLPFTTIKVSLLASTLPYTLHHTTSAKLNCLNSL